MLSVINAFENFENMTSCLMVIGIIYVVIPMTSGKQSNRNRTRILHAFCTIKKSSQFQKFIVLFTLSRYFYLCSFSR